MVRTIYQQLSPAEVHGRLDRVMEQLLEPFPRVPELLVGAVLAKQHDEWAEARPKGKSCGTEFAQPPLRLPAITAIAYPFDTSIGSHNSDYVNRFVRGLAALARLRFSSTVTPPDPITSFVIKRTWVASDFEAIPSRHQRRFSSFASVLVFPWRPNWRSTPHNATHPQPT